MTSSSIASSLARNLASGLAGADEASLVSIFGSNLVEYWDSRYGVNLVGGEVDSWVGRVQGISVPAVSAALRPTYNTSDGNFSDKPSISFTEAGRCLYLSSHGSAIIAAGTRPYIAVIGRLRSIYTPGAPRVRKWSLFNAGINAQCVENYIWNASSDYVAATLSTGAHEAGQSVGGQDTGTRVEEVVFNATGGMTYYRDGAPLGTVAGATGTLVDAADRVCIGGVNGSQGANYDMVQFVICAAEPTEAQLSRFRNLAFFEWT